MSWIARGMLITHSGYTTCVVNNDKMIVIQGAVEKEVKELRDKLYEFLVNHMSCFAICAPHIRRLLVHIIQFF